MAKCKRQPINLIKTAIGEGEITDYIENSLSPIFNHQYRFKKNDILIFPEIIDKYFLKRENGTKHGFVLCKVVTPDGYKTIYPFYLGLYVNKFNQLIKEELDSEIDLDNFNFSKIDGVSFQKYFLDIDSDFLEDNASDIIASQLAGKHLLVSDSHKRFVYERSRYHKRYFYDFVSISPDYSLNLLTKYEKDGQMEWQKDIRIIRECVNGWPMLFDQLPYNFLLNYYPITCEFEASESEWEDRRTVWNFKNMTDRITRYKHKETLDRILPLLEFNLIFDFGVYLLKKITLVCIPASNQINNEARYKEFSDRLCSKTGMTNSYDRIVVLHDKEERRYGGTSINMANLYIDEAFFKDRYILLFDDVITRGDSMMTFKSKMESLGAHVIAGVCIGRTRHEH